MKLSDLSLDDFTLYWTLFSLVLVPTVVAISHGAANWSISIEKAADKSPAKWDDGPAHALRWFLVGFAANADRVSRLVAALLPIANVAKDAMKNAGRPPSPPAP